MNKNDYLDAYLNGIADADIDRLMGSLAESYVMDDPANGLIPKAEMPGYINAFAEAVRTMRGGNDSAPILELSEKIVSDDGDGLTAMVWWQVPGTPMEGGGWIKIGADGVVSERLTYYAKPGD
jgi:hypothetical protein